MDRAALHIESLPGALRCTWSPPSGDAVTRVRAVHDDDVSAAESALADAPRSLIELERIGARICSRLLDREVRNALFSAPRCAVLLDTDQPLIPWELASTGGRFLADVHAIGRAPEAEVTNLGASLRVLLVADPTGDLPYSLGEAREIADRLRTATRVHLDVFTGAAATRDAVLAALETSPYDVIHFSCHAQHDPQHPALSHVRLFDGALTAEDIYQTDVALPPALCVLNACESGRVGADARIAGLASAFRAAGAAAVVGAMWPVGNKPSAYWMASFYASLVSGDTLGEAAGNARAETRRLFSHDEMLTWSAFTLNGAPWIRLVPSGDRVRLGRAPLIGRKRERGALDDAWRACQAGVGSIVILMGPSGSGKTRLLDDWLASIPPARVMRRNWRSDVELPAIDAATVLVFEEVELDVAEHLSVLGSLASACRSSPLLAAICSRGLPERCEVPGNLRIIPLTPLKGTNISALFGALGAVKPPNLVEATPGEVERIALGLPRGDSASVLAAALPAPERCVLRAAAVWGESFTVDALGRLLDTGRGDSWRPLESLCAAAWIVETSPGAFRFRDSADRDGVLAAFVPAGERVEMERHAASLCENDGDMGSAGLHLMAAGEPDMAAIAFESALTQSGTPGEVLRWTEALTDIGRMPEDPAIPAAAFAETGDWPNARIWWSHALETATNRGNVLLCLAEACLKTGDMPATDRYLSEAEAFVDDASLDLARAEALLHSRNPAEALDRARLALAEARANGDNALAAKAALLAANAALLLAKRTEAMAACDAGFSCNPDAAIHSGLTRALAQARQYAGDYAAAEATLRDLSEEQRDAGRPHDRAATLMALAQVWRDQGRLEKALTGLEETSALAEPTREAAVIAETANLRSSVLRRQGRYEEAQASAEAAAQAAGDAGLEPEAIRARIHIATALAERGCLASSRGHTRVAIAEARDAGYQFGEAWGNTVEGLACLEAEDNDSAEPRFREALSLSENIHGHIGTASALHYLAWLAWLRGQPADDLFIRAEGAAARISYRAVQYASAFGLALCREDSSSADEAIAGIESLNMGALVPWLREKRGAWHLSHERFDDALKDLAPAYRVARRIGMRMVQARCAAGLADIYASTGDTMENALRDEAGALRDECMANW